MISNSRRHHAPVPVDLDSENLAECLTRDVKAADDDGLPLSSESHYLSDDKLSPESGNDWHAIRRTLYFGYQEVGRVIGKAVGRVSAMPFSDKVLTRNGNEVLTQNAIAAIRRLSTKYVDSENLHVHDGPFGCIFKYSENGDVPNVTGDRPFPYFYTRDAPGLKGRLFHIVRTSAEGRIVKFVQKGGDRLVPDDLREQVLYLLPDEAEWCAEVITKFLPLNWQPSRGVSSGYGKNVYIFQGFFATTDLERSFEEDKRNCKGSLIFSTVLEVHDGVVENVALDESMYHPAVIEMVHEAAGKRVKIYRPLHEAEDEDFICRKVLKRVERYDQLLEKIGGCWPKTATAVKSCLSVSMTELIVAGIYHPDVRERFPELYCFLERRAECFRDSKKGSEEGTIYAGSGSQATTHTKEASNTRISATVEAERDGIPINLLMTQFYKYSQVTKSYYAINRPVDKPVAISSDGILFHFTESNVPVPVFSTPLGVVACGARFSTS